MDFKTCTCVFEKHDVYIIQTYSAHEQCFHSGTVYSGTTLHGCYTRGPDLRSIVFYNKLSTLYTTTTHHYTTHTMKLQQDQHEGRPQQHDSWHSTVGDTTRRVKAHAPPPPPPHQPLLIDSFLSTPISAHNCIVVSSYIVSSAGESQ